MLLLKEKGLGLECLNDVTLHLMNLHLNCFNKMKQGELVKLMS